MGLEKQAYTHIMRKHLDDKTIKSLTDEDAIFKTNMRRKPDKSEKAVIKAVKESLKPRVNAAVEAAEKKRNNLNLIRLDFRVFAVSYLFSASKCFC